MVEQGAPPQAATLSHFDRVATLFGTKRTSPMVCSPSLSGGRVVIDCSNASSTCGGFFIGLTNWQVEGRKTVVQSLLRNVSELERTRMLPGKLGGTLYQLWRNVLHRSLERIECVDVPAIF